MLKDNIFLQERNLTEKIKLCYDTELRKARMMLGDYKKQLLEYQANINNQMARHVREQENTIDDVLTKRLRKYGDLDEPTPNQLALENYKKGLVNVNNTTINIENMVISKKDGTVHQKGSMDPNIEYEMNVLKKNEKEARDEVQ